MIKIKICGIKNINDAYLAYELGAWAIGFIFVNSSLRYIEPDDAFKISKTLPTSLEKIGVFANSSIEEIKNTVKTSKITKIQLHGDESPEFCKELLKSVNLPIIKAFRIKELNDIFKINNYKGLTDFILLDSYSPNELGGTGESFNWEIAKEAKKLEVPIILSGGITPENLAEAHNYVAPYAIDLSSGVEKTKGVKDHQKLKKLFSVAAIL